MIIVGHILQDSHVYYVFYWIQGRVHFCQVDKILRSYLWSQYGGVRGLPLVSLDVFTIPNDEGGLGLIDVVEQGSILVTKWVVR